MSDPRPRVPAPRMHGLGVLASVPAAMHLLYTVGFQSSDNRVLFHRLFGCVFYGAFVTKMVLLISKSLPGWMIRIAGGLVLRSGRFQINGVFLQQPNSERVRYAV